MPSPNAGYTPEQIEFAAQVIRDTFDPLTGQHPEPIFHAFNATAVRSVVELVISTPDTDDVLLIKRPEDDPYYSGAWHLPGVIVVLIDINTGMYDNAFDNAALRAKEELKGTKITPLLRLSPEWLDQAPRISRRGGEAPVFYGAYLLDEKPKIGELFSRHDLPELIHEHHPTLIQAAPESVFSAIANQVL